MSKRRLVVHGVEYTYVVGTTFVKIIGPTSSRAVPLTEIKGLNWEAIERGHWKRTTDGMVRPAEVAAYIAATFSASPEDSDEWQMSALDEVEAAERAPQEDSDDVDWVGALELGRRAERGGQE